MSSFPAISNEICSAAMKGDFATVRSLATSPDLLNVFRDDESLLDEVVYDFTEYPEKTASYRAEMVRELIRLGANPNLLSEEGASPLTTAMLAMDTELLDVLLACGANPNLPCGFGKEQSLYDWAKMDYDFEIWIHPEQWLGKPGRASLPTAEDRAGEDAWLAYLDRCAVTEGLRRPDYIFVLRKYGALSRAEQAGEWEYQ